MSLRIHLGIVFQNSFFQYFQQSEGARKTLLSKYRKEPNIVCFFI